MSVAKWQAAAKVIDVLKQVPNLEVLYIGSLALDPWLPWGTHPSDDLQLLIRHDDLNAFTAAMAANGYVPACPQNGNRVDPDPGHAGRIQSMPASPEANYVDHSCMMGHPPDLWITFHTTKRHGRLPLVDLANWFLPANKRQIQVMTQANPRQVYVPAPWAILLWQAAEVTCAAAEWGIAKYDVDRLKAVADSLTANEWNKVQTNAPAYDNEYHRRLGHPVAVGLMQTYQHALGLNDADLQTAECQYGALYELSHALRAVKAYGGLTDPAAAQVWQAVEPIVRQQPRKLWDYPGVVHGGSVPPQASVGGRLGLAEDAFGIYEQIQNYPGATFSHLLAQGRIQRLLIPAAPGWPAAPPHGPWAACTPPQLAQII